MGWVSLLQNGLETTWYSGSFGSLQCKTKLQRLVERLEFGVIKNIYTFLLIWIFHIIGFLEIVHGRLDKKRVCIVYTLAIRHMYDEGMTSGRT